MIIRVDSISWRLERFMNRVTMHFIIRLFVVASLLGLSPVCVKAQGPAEKPRARVENWVQWRGPTADGRAGDYAKPPTHWDKSTNIAWSVDLPGEGSATPIVFGNQVFTLSAVKTERKSPMPVVNDQRAKTTPDECYYQFVMSSYDRSSGKTLWQQVVVEEVPHEGKHDTNTYAAGSAVTDGERLYFSFGSRGVFCYSLDGTLVWSLDLGDMRTRNGWGEAVTPALTDDSVVINWDQEEGSFIAAIDKQSGQIRWKKDRAGEVTSWNTPLVTNFTGTQQIIVNGTGSVKSYDAKDGSVLWECGGQTVNAIPSPIRCHDSVICMSGYRGSLACSIPLTSRGNITDSDKINWKISQGTPYVPSPILVGTRLLFTAGNTNVLSCLDVNTGQPLLERRRLDAIRSMYASPLLADGHVYFTSREGTTVVVKDNESLDVVAVNELDDVIDASPVAVDDQLFLRSWNKLYCIQNTQTARPNATSPQRKEQIDRETRDISGWQVHIAKKLLETEADDTAKALDGLKKMLDEIVRDLPAEAVVEMKKVPLYFSPSYQPGGSGADFHPGADWLRDNGRDPAMAQGVEFSGVDDFEAEMRRMPNFALHELAHAFHFRSLPDGFDNTEIKAAYQRAKQRGIYDRVERTFGNGEPNTFEQAYAMTTAMEYFAEATEAYFSRNDFFPFTRAELLRHDPEMHALLEKLWGLPAAEWLKYPGADGPGKGKHIVLIAAEQEYRSEQSMPMLAKILSTYHGFDCTVLFGVNESGEVDPTQPVYPEKGKQAEFKEHHISGLEQLASADLVIFCTRLLTLPKSELDQIVEYVDSGRPIIAIRTANHGFRDPLPYKIDGKQVRWGEDILGGTFLNHHGHWHADSTRGFFDKDQTQHPIVMGVSDIWGDSDVYRTYQEGTSLPSDCTALVWGQPLMGRKPDDLPNEKLEPLPVAWVKPWQTSHGTIARVFHCTMGSATDFKNQGLRRLVVNAAYWCVGLEASISATRSVDVVGSYEPLESGFNYEELGVKPRPVNFYK
jgi:outer membrane protein assembly factor BamB